VDRENRLIQREDGSWYCGGWEYSIVASTSATLGSGTAEPGSYRKRIKAYRDAISSARHMPGNAKVVVDLTVNLGDEYQRRAVEEVPKAFPVTETPTGYEIPVTDEDQLLWKLTHLPRECTSWVFDRIQVSDLDQQQLQMMFA